MLCCCINCISLDDDCLVGYLDVQCVLCIVECASSPFFSGITHNILHIGHGITVQVQQGNILALHCWGMSLKAGRRGGREEGRATPKHYWIMLNPPYIPNHFFLTQRRIYEYVMDKTDNIPLSSKGHTENSMQVRKWEVTVKKLYCVCRHCNCTDMFPHLKPFLCHFCNVSCHTITVVRVVGLCHIYSPLLTVHVVSDSLASPPFFTHTNIKRRQQHQFPKLSAFFILYCTVRARESAKKPLLGFLTFTIQY